MKPFVLSLLCWFFAIGTAAAQDVVGSSLVNGKQVQLMSDFTWRYTASPISDCTTIESDVSFCGLAGGWQRTTSNNGDAKAVFRKNDRSYGMFIVEALGSADGMTSETMRGLVVGNAADAAGIQAKDVPVLSVTPATIDGHAATTVVYAIRLNGLNLVYSNTIITEPKRNIQAVTFGIGTELTEEMTEDHRQFLAAVQFK